MIDEVIDGRTVIAESDRFILMWDGRDEGESIDNCPLILRNKFSDDLIASYRVLDQHRINTCMRLMIDAESGDWYEDCD